MQWVIDNWLLVLLGGGMLAMHLFGHGHGHGRKTHRDRADDGPDGRADPAPSETAEEDRNA